MNMVCKNSADSRHGLAKSQCSASVVVNTVRPTNVVSNNWN